MNDLSAEKHLRIGLFGGTFDPVHEGHLAVARAALVQLRLDKVIFIPSGIPPAAQKSRPIAPPQARLAMLELALRTDPQFGISDFEILRAGISYTVETIRHMAACHPQGAAFFFLMGDDCAGKLPHWVGIDEMRAQVQFVAVTRGETEFQAPPWLMRLTMPRNPISSSDIRHRIAAGISIDGLVPLDVADFISRESLYSESAFNSLSLEGEGRGEGVPLADQPPLHPAFTPSPSRFLRNGALPLPSGEGNASLICDRLALQEEEEQKQIHPNALTRLGSVLDTMSTRIVACSGGIDSMLLATVASRNAPASTLVVHATSPAVPASATERVRDWSRRENWALEIVTSGEFQDEAYLANPLNRCYFCKTNLYDKLAEIARAVDHLGPAGVLLSGANLDDLGEYRPGLIAASEHGVRHPFVEAEITKEEIRAAARSLNMPFAELPASPCLSSRLYTGTRVTAGRLAAIEAGENHLREAAAIRVVRCRIRRNDMLIEVPDGDRRRLSSHLLAEVARVVKAIEPSLDRVVLDAEAYRPGRAFIEA